MKNSIESMPWGTFDGEEVRLWRLVNANGLELQFTNFGGRLIKAIVPDRNGHFENVTLGWPTLDEYVAENGGTYYGALVGRYGNRIGAGKFTLGGKEYTLELNNEPAGIPCALHGGLRGFSLRNWTVLEEIPATGPCWRRSTTRTRWASCSRSSRPTARAATPAM